MTTIEIPPRPTWLKRKPTRTTEAAERAAHKFGVSPAQVLALMPEALALIRQDFEQREAAKALARRLTGLDARIIASRENRYIDHSTATNFDTAARSVALECPELGFDPDGHDTPACVWELIREGKLPVPVRHSDCVAELAASWCEMIEVDDFPDDADGFNPDDFTTDPVYVAGTVYPVCDVQPKERPNGQAATNEDSGNHLRMRASRHGSACWNHGRGTPARANHRPVTMPNVRSVNVAGSMVRSGRAGQNAYHGRAEPRLGRVVTLHPVYVAGTMFVASCRSRDGPRMMRYPVSVV